MCVCKWDRKKGRNGDRQKEKENNEIESEVYIYIYIYIYISIVQDYFRKIDKISLSENLTNSYINDWILTAPGEISLKYVFNF